MSSYINLFDPEIAENQKEIEAQKTKLLLLSKRPNPATVQKLLEFLKDLSALYDDIIKKHNAKTVALLVVELKKWLECYDKLEAPEDQTALEEEYKNVNNMLTKIEVLMQVEQNLLVLIEEVDYLIDVYVKYPSYAVRDKIKKELKRLHEISGPLAVDFSKIIEEIKDYLLLPIE